MVAPLPLCSPPFHDWKLYVFGLSSGHPYAHSPSNRVATNVGTCRTKPEVVDVNLLVMSASLLLPTLLSLHTACTLHRRLNRRMRIHCMDLNRRRVRRPTYKTSPGNKLPGSEGVVAQINSLHGHAQKMDSVEEINLLLKGTFDEST